MSSYKLTNNSGGLLVCDLAVEGETLRLNNKQSKTIKENEITPHITHLVKKGLILSELVSAETKPKRTTQKSK